MSQHGTILHAARGAGHHRELAARIQCDPSALIARLSPACAGNLLPGRSALRNMEAPAGSAFHRSTSICYIEPGCARGGGSFVGDDQILVHNCKPVRALFHRHHAWPKYLGGPKRQDLQRLPKHLHEAYHSGLDKILPRQRGAAYYESLGPAARRQMERDLADYTKAFDAKHGTQIYQSRISNGFPGE